jgi:hypothetical protein
MCLLVTEIWSHYTAQCLTMFPPAPPSYNMLGQYDWYEAQSSVCERKQCSTCSDLPGNLNEIRNITHVEGLGTLFIESHLYLHFVDNKIPMQDRKSWLWHYRKSEKYLEVLNSKCSELCLPTQYLAMDKVIIKFKQNVIFQHYIPRKYI